MILYKYYPCNNFTYKSLAVRALWCHTYEKMNEPFECLAVIERKFSSSDLNKYREIISQSTHPSFQKLLEFNNIELSNVLNMFRKENLKKYAFCSLSEDPNNILLWSHYSNNHSGIVIGFQFPELKNNHHLQKVTYKNNLSPLNIERLANFNITASDEYLHDFFIDYSIKSKDWEYEKEWRIWRNKPCYYKYQKEQIKEVHFGINTDIETKAIILRLLDYLPKDFVFHQKELSTSPIGLK